MGVTTTTIKEFSASDAVEGYYIAQILKYLLDVNILQELEKPKNIRILAKKINIAPEFMFNLCEYLTQRTNILKRIKKDIYQLTRNGRDKTKLKVPIIKYMKRFGWAIDNLPAISVGDFRNEKATDGKYAAEMYELLIAKTDPIILELFNYLDITVALDLGCGSGDFLLDFCHSNINRYVVGIEYNPYQVQLAVKKIKNEKLNNRASIYNGNITDIKSILSSKSRSKIELIHCRQVLNSFFGDYENITCLDFLNLMSSIFPGKYVVIADYYGKLGRKVKVKPSQRDTLMHDMVQALSGQGVPPATKKEWLEIYRTAYCDVIVTYEGKSEEIDWFVHVLQLPF